MVDYECNTCGFSSKLKGDYKRHLKTIKHFKNVSQLNHNDEKTQKKTQKDPKIKKKDPKIKKKTQKDPVDLICIFCKKIYSSYAHKRRHEIHRCKLNTKNNIITELQREKEELKNQVELLLTKVGNTTNNTINNTIILNNYGKEDMSHITDIIKTQLLKIPYGMIPKMIEAVHFNDNKPENKNIIMTNVRDNKLKVFKNNKWIYKDKSETLNDLVDSKYFILDTHYDKTENNNKLNDYQTENYKKFRELIDTGDKNLIENIKNDFKIILLNNR